MPVHNSDISDMLRKAADLLEIEGADEFRVRSYRQAARSIDNLTENLTDKVSDGEDLTGIPDVGESIAEKIEEIVKTGSLKQLEEIKKRVPEELADLLNLEGIGPKRAKEIYDELDVDSITDLREAVEKHKVREIEGFGKKTEEKIGRELERQSNQESRTLLSRAEEIAEPLLEYLNECKEADRIVIAGSYRRRKETVGDLDILATGEDEEAIANHFVSYEDVDEVIKKGEKRTSIRLKSGLQVDMAVLSKESFGAALIYFTGSKEHGIHLRERALARDLKVNEYGIFREGEDEPIAGETEEEMYEALDLAWVPPEMRENRGEIELAEKDNLPDLITLDDIKGDIHMHTTYTDGGASIREMAEAARDLGYQYIAITDHSKRVNVAGGLDADELAEQLKEIDELNDETDGIRILKGAEVDILEDGSLDLPDDILSRLDLRICSVHYHMDMDSDKQTERILKAMDNPWFDILAHPTGRLLQKREAMELDLEAIMDKAAEKKILMEINANPERLDLNDRNCKMAMERGLMISVATDAHSIGDLKNMKYGVYQARRGWLEPKNVVNTLGVDELLEHFGKNG
ncbi:DNA polymerase/3'-5' exonuclease PolX [Rhodohalobacter mucosus]|uniref:DNA polymerase beta n=1 Tax=Rhodohalobacter mucosus TaxID=2079485 RepID=A0A316U0Z0_9BACT|nr:DNA polymerase/3'-5' exonuclease PolX [Rhodohalobacter mucosus]PWN06486.1 DNA polymerase/3'-5' exonuclease PolX [Rhodohalobacter mucosus]